MNVIFSIALILAVTVNLGNCSPTHSPKSPKAEKSDSHEQLTVALGALKLDGALKLEEHDQSSPAFRFSATLLDVISKNDQMYSEIKGYSDCFDDSDWAPVKFTIIKMKMAFDISASEGLTALKKQYNAYKPKLVELLGKMKTAHEQNQKLAEAVNGFVDAETKLGGLTAETKIDPKLSEELQKEAKKVTDIFQKFENLMAHFQMKSYIQRLEVVRATIVKLKDGKMYLDEAEKIFDENVFGSNELIAPNLETLEAAMKIHYADLAKANQQIQGIVKKVVHVAAPHPAKHAKK